MPCQGEGRGFESRRPLHMNPLLSRGFWCFPLDSRLLMVRVPQERSSVVKCRLDTVASRAISSGSTLSHRLALR